MDPETIPVYEYIEKTPTWVVRSVYLFGAATWISVLYGYGRMIPIINPLYLFILIPSIIFFTLYFAVSYFIDIFYKQVNIKTHHRLVERFWNQHPTTPSVDIFITTCGESTEVIRRTCYAVFKLNYANRKIYLLDDKGINEHELLAKRLGISYLSRENKGYMKKAGNLLHGLERSTGEFVVIFDADFAPHPDFITELLPYMSDPHVGIVQSPQYFQTDGSVHKRSLLEYGASHVQEDFYRFIQVARDRLGAPICCGSNAIYRRSALNSIGGVSQVEHSEDMETGFNLLVDGWRVKYVPLILAVGLCPDNLQAYFHQQHRWCSGSLGLMLNKKFWQSNISFSQKICFISGFLYYMSYPLTILLSFQIFLFLFYYYNSITLVNALPFIPAILFSFVVIPAFRLSRSRPGGLLARTAYSFCYSHAVVTAFVKKSIGWQPTNTKRMEVSKAYQQLVLFNAIYFFIYMALLGVALNRGLLNLFNVNAYSVFFLIFYNIAANAFLLFHLYSVLDHSRQRQLATGTIGLPALVLWRVRTAGVYIALVASIFLIGTIR